MTTKTISCLWQWRNYKIEKFIFYKNYIFLPYFWEKFRNNEAFKLNENFNCLLLVEVFTGDNHKPWPKIIADVLCQPLQLFYWQLLGNTLYVPASLFITPSLAPPTWLSWYSKSIKKVKDKATFAICIGKILKSTLWLLLIITVVTLNKKHFY